MKFIELFAGISGFGLGLQPLGHECGFASEIDKYARQTYKANFGVEPHGDITEIAAKDIPDHDILTAGFPCVAFSVAGHRRGFEDTRGTLFFEIARIAKEKQPKWLFLENVKGLKSHDKSKTLQIIIQTLYDLGYGVDFKVLTTADFGPPQKRERIFIVCKRGEDQLWRFDWPAPTVKEWGCVADIMEEEVDEKYFISDEQLKTAFFNKMSSNGIPFPDDKNKPARTLDTMASPTSRAAILVDEDSGEVIRPKDYKKLKQVGHLNNGSDIGGRIYDPAGVARTITDGGGQGAKTGLYVIGARKRKGCKHYDRKDSIFSDQGLARTLTSNHDSEGQAGLYLRWRRVRRLTPRECARLQGFPDSFKIEVSDTQAYKQFGNAVSAPVITAIAKQIEKDY